MKKFFLLFIIVIVSAFSFIHFVTIPNLIQSLGAEIKAHGFSNADIEGINYKIDGLTIKTINLDKDNFSHAKNVSLKFFWPSFIFNNQLKFIIINQLNLVFTTKEVINELASINPEKINIPSNISIPNISIDIATKNNPIRLIGNFKSNMIGDTNEFLLNVSATQDDLSFMSEIIGQTNANNGFNLNGNISNLNISHHSFGLNRANAWFSIQDKQDDFDLSVELNAGNGKILSLPIQSISLTAGKIDNVIPVIFRSKVSGNEKTTLSADINFAKSIDDQNFNIRFNSNEFKKLLGYLSIQKIIDPKLIGKFDFQNLMIEAQFLKERRFADGPWPFRLTGRNQNDESATGIFLLYPNELNFRGSLEGNDNIVKFLGHIMDVKDQESNILRVDKDIKDFLIGNYP